MLFVFLLGEGHGPGRREKTEGTEGVQFGVSREGASKVAGTAASSTLWPAKQKWVNLSLKRVSRECTIMRNTVHLYNWKDRGIRYP